MRPAPPPGTIILMGIKDIALAKIEFLAETSDHKFIYWKEDKTRVLYVSREFCYDLEGNPFDINQV